MGLNGQLKAIKNNYIDKKNNKLITIWTGNTEVEANLIKNLLLNNDIKAYIEGGIIGTTAPHIAAGGGVGAVKVVIHAKNYKNANLVIKKYEDKYL